MHIEGLDETDSKILAELVKNARLSYSELGEKVGVSRVSVKNRMEALEKKGIIRGYMAVVDSNRAPEGKHFFIDICTEPDKFNEIVDRLARYSTVRKLYATTGDSRLKAECFSSDAANYELFLRSVRKEISGVRSFIVQNIQYTVKDVDAGIEYVPEETKEQGGSNEGSDEA